MKLSVMLQMKKIIKNEYTAYTFTKWIICISAPYVLITS